MTDTNKELDHLVNQNEEQQEPTITIVLPVSAVNVTMAALQELPHRVADPILKSIFQQAQSQLGG